MAEAASIRSHYVVEIFSALHDAIKPWSPMVPSLL